jgi:hypothetical protein
MRIRTSGAPDQTNLVDSPAIGINLDTGNAYPAEQAAKSLEHLGNFVSLHPKTYAKEATACCRDTSGRSAL